MKNYKKKYYERLTLSPGLLQEKETFYGYRCLHCYEPLREPNTHVHQACNKRFYGQLKTPELHYKHDDLQLLASQIIQSQMAVTGVQAKVSLSLYRKAEKNLTKKLTIVGLYGDYILKPPSEFYPELPELESVTMHMAAICGLHVVPHSLIRLEDETLCYITKRVDRTKNGKLHMEDMCQLSERLTEDKYKGSHEQIAKLILKYSNSPLLDITHFLELVLFSFLTGNSDMMPSSPPPGPTWKPARSLRPTGPNAAWCRWAWPSPSRLHHTRPGQAMTKHAWAKLGRPQAASIPQA